MAESNSTPRNLVAAAYDWLKRYKEWITLAIFVIANVLNLVGSLVKFSWIAPVSGIAFLMVMTERVTGIGTDVGKVLDQQNRVRQPVFTLADAMKDLQQRLGRLQRPKKITIQHLGLDMTEAWKELKAALATCDAVMVECTVLIMTDDPDQLGPDAPSEMHTWCKSVPASIQRIADETAKLADDLADRHTQLCLTLMKYTGTPRIHGVVITEPFERGYVSFASWALKGQFEWGGEDYFRFENGTESDGDRRLRQLLRGAFEYHLNRNPTPVFEYQASVSPAPAVAHTP